MKTDDELFEQIFAEHCTIGCHEYREEIRNSVLAALKIERERAKVAEMELIKLLIQVTDEDGDKFIMGTDWHDKAEAAIRRANYTVECKWEDNCK